jgi:hypothetical protein
MNLTYLLYFGIIIYMYLTTTVAAQIGIDQVGAASSLVIVMLSLIYIMSRNISGLPIKIKQELFVISLALTIMVIKFITGDLDAIKHALFFFIVPSLMSILLKNQSNRVKEKIVYIILIFYITECLLALFERVNLVHLFPYNDLIEYSTITTLGFRSTAFLGHPLQNALVVSTIMGFILTMNFKLEQKMLLIVLGYSALLCFNARGAIIVWTILIIVYLFSIALSKREKLLSIPMIIFITVAVYLLYEMIVNQGFGDRLFMADRIMDGSVMTRLQVFNAFSYISNMDFWLGNSSSYIYVMDKLEAGGVENSYIGMILKYGLVMGLASFVALFFWVKQLLMPYTSYNKIIITISFILVGSMNNGLVSANVWGFFILCINTSLLINRAQNKSNTIT